MTVLLDANSSLNPNRAPIMDLSKGGQNGAMMMPHEIAYSAGYAKQRVIPVVMALPDAIRYLPDAAYVRKTLKSLLEVHAMRIDGLNQTEELEFDEKAIGNAGEMFETAVRNARQRSNVSYTWGERKNQSIGHFFRYLNRMLILDADLGVPGITALDSYIQAGSPSLMPSDQSATMMFVEPDETMRNVVHVWMQTNFMPKGHGEIVGRRETHYTSEVPEIQIDFTGTGMPPGETLNRLGKAYLESLQLNNLRPTESKPFVNGISADVQAAATGFKDKMESVINSTL